MSGSWRRYFHQAHGDRETLEKVRKTMYPQVMDTQQRTEKDRRDRIVAFWEKHGLQATQDAFGVSRATLFRWKTNSVPRSRRHKTQYHKRIIPPKLATELVRLRAIHPRLGKQKLVPLLGQFCQTHGLPLCSEATIGRMLTQLKDQGRLTGDGRLRLDARTGKLHLKQKPSRSKQRRQGYLPRHPGDLVQVDTIVTFILGLKRYTHTAIDCTGRFAFALSYSSASSRTSTDFLAKLMTVTPFQIKAIQTDNGSEFLNHFDRTLQSNHITHFFTYPRHPQSNGTVERFNRTIQEEFLTHHLQTLATDIPDFNRRLVAYLLWYNGERIHQGLHNQTPCGYLKLHGQSHLAWTRTDH